MSVRRSSSLKSAISSEVISNIDGMSNPADYSEPILLDEVQAFHESFLDIFQSIHANLQLRSSKDPDCD
jgi:hypothetical protein